MTTYLLGSDVLVGAYPSITSLAKPFIGPVKVWHVLAASGVVLTLMVSVMPITGTLTLAAYIGGILVGLKLA